LVNWTSLTEPKAAEVEASVAPERRGRAYAITRLALSNFRCYAHAVLEVDSRPLVLTGPNGAGKTNLLEAISLLAPGRGLRRARLGEIDRLVAGGSAAAGGAWAVSARIMGPQGPRELGSGRDPKNDTRETTARDRRLIKVDGVFARGQQALGEAVSVVWLTPQMDGLFREPASGRRRFLDRLVYGFDPSHAGRVAAYEQVLRDRSRLLRTGGGDAAWLASLEDSLARHGVAIAAARRALMARLAGACAAGAGRFPRAGMGLIGAVESWLDELSALAAEDRLRESLAASRAQDAEAGGAAVGPHRSDLAVRHLENGLAAEICSTGEQKALLISIVLAHARLLALDSGATPLLLLDEVVAHLDEQRRAALFEELLALGAQAWMTGTQAALFDDLRASAQYFLVSAARITRAD
jgi:DNA replication and repair protein RecF